MQIINNIYNVGVGGNNSYLIKGEKTALIDTVAKYTTERLIQNIEEIVPVSKIDYLVLNHTEQDKSGAAAAILEKNRDIEIVATTAALRNLKEMLNGGFNEHVAKDNAVLDLGNGLKLKFLITPNINWPDSMVTYEEKNKILFSCDMFSEYGETDDYFSSLFGYYAEKLKLYSDYAENALEKISELEINMLCPGYGKYGENVNTDDVIDFYKAICPTEIPEGKHVAVIYATMYENSEEMGECIKKTLEHEGSECYFADVTQNLYGYDIEELLEADAFVFGTYTINRGADKELLKFIAELEPAKMRGKPYFTFGSYGWSGEGPQIVHDLLKDYGMKPFSKPFMSIFSLSEDKREELIEHTQKFAEFIYKEN